MRSCGGLTVDETAVVLRISPVGQARVERCQDLVVPRADRSASFHRQQMGGRRRSHAGPP